jgi:hypothetical protein
MLTSGGRPWRWPWSERPSRLRLTRCPCSRRSRAWARTSVSCAWRRCLSSPVAHGGPIVCPGAAWASAPGIGRDTRGDLRHAARPCGAPMGLCGRGALGSPQPSGRPPVSGPLRAHTWPGPGVASLGPHARPGGRCHGNTRDSFRSGPLAPERRERSRRACGRPEAPGGVPDHRAREGSSPFFPVKVTERTRRFSGAEEPS